jgi:DNA polymerase III epsilon subunit-like protein
MKVIGVVGFVLMRTPRTPPSDENFGPSDFQFPSDAFYWLGAHACKRQRRAPAEHIKKPLCEVAEFVAFDTETSGLSSEDVAIQVAVGFFREDGSALGFYNKLWKLPAGARINGGSYKIHRISQRKLNSEGCEAAFEVKSVLKIMQRMRARGKKLVAHNASFDARMLQQTARRHGVKGWNITRADLFCTMQAAKTRCGMTSQRTGKRKSPSNAELFKYFFGKAPTGALHDAVVDIRVTAKSYVEGKARGWW